jgi:hypothetical protein
MSMKIRFGTACIAVLALIAVSAFGAASAQATPTCSSSYNPTEVTGASNAAGSLTAITAKWKIPPAVEKELAEQTVNVWVNGSLRSTGRKETDKTIADRSFVFNNSGEKGEASEGAEPGFIEPGTAYNLAVTAIYGKSATNPAGCVAEAAASKATTTRRIFGVNGGLCCSKEINSALGKNAETLVSDGIASDRIETYNSAELEGEETYGNSLANTAKYHFVNNDVIVGNTDDAERLSTITTSTWAKEAREQVEHAAANGNVLMEVGNEMWLKGQCSECTEPAKYGEMFVALSKEVQKAKESKAIPQDVKLLFDLTGDYYLGGSKWSNANEKHGWLGDALAAQPELKSRIEGFTFHPYDVEGLTLAEEEKLVTYEYDYGLRGMKRDYEEAVELGIKHTNVYATEFGICANKECNTGNAAKTEAEENKQAETVYSEMLGANFPELKGLWWYDAYPVEDKYGFFKGWNGGEATKLLATVKSLSAKG